MGLVHFDDAPSYEFELGHLRGRWSLLGDAAGCSTAGVKRIELPAGAWSTPAHDHGRSEELFFVLSGQGLSWVAGKTAEISAGDCILYRPRGGEHSLHALEPLDVLAFGPRERDESVGFPRLGLSAVGSRFVESLSGQPNGPPLQYVREAELGPPELPEPGPRPATIVNLDAVEARLVERPRIARTRRNLGQAVGSVNTGLQRVEVVPDKLSAPLHCHSLEEEIFVILGGEGTLLLDSEETPVRPGHVICRPAASGISHAFRAGQAGLTYLAYGPREPGDICYYPTSQKLGFGGVSVICRVQSLDYWDGED